MKKITVTLSDKAEKYFNELMYSIDEEKDTTYSRAINWSLEALDDFEQHAGQDLVGWLEDNYKIYSNPPKP